MHGVHPKANAKPSRKPLSELANGPLSVRPAFVPPRLRKCRSRLSQRVRLGPARKISDSAISSAGPNVPRSGGQRANPQGDPGGGQDGADDRSHAHRDLHQPADQVQSEQDDYGAGEGVEHEARVRRARYAPADDATGVGVDDERDVDEALPRRDVGEVRDPQHVRPWRPELAINVIERTGRGAIAHRRAYTAAADHSLQSHFLHQSRHRAAADVVPFPEQLAPDFAHAVDLEVLIENPFDLDAEHDVALDARRCCLWLGAPGNMGVVGRRGDLNNSADRLDPVFVAVRIDEADHGFHRRSSSAWAKYALALRRISLA